jgi:hypothetical protein
MSPEKAYLTDGKTFWFVPVRKANSKFATDYLHADGIVRFSTQNRETGSYTGKFKTREAARQAIKLHDRLKSERTAEVFAHDGNGGIGFKITGLDGFSLTGSEPYGEFAGRDFSHTMLAVGMVLRTYGVKDFKFHWKRP